MKLQGLLTCTLLDVRNDGCVTFAVQTLFVRSWEALSQGDQASATALQGFGIRPSNYRVLRIEFRRETARLGNTQNRLDAGAVRFGEDGPG